MELKRRVARGFNWLGLKGRLGDEAATENGDCGAIGCGSPDGAFAAPATPLTPVDDHKPDFLRRKFLLGSKVAKSPWPAHNERSSSVSSALSSLVSSGGVEGPIAVTPASTPVAPSALAEARPGSRDLGKRVQEAIQLEGSNSEDDEDSASIRGGGGRRPCSTLAVGDNTVDHGDADEMAWRILAEVERASHSQIWEI